MKHTCDCGAALEQLREENERLEVKLAERGKRMKKMYSWLDWGGFEALQDFDDVKYKWFDPETGEPL